jgi:transcriptional regulator with XRE-family HTH domain
MTGKMLSMQARTRQVVPRHPFDLRAERLNRGFSQKSLAGAIGVNREVIRRLENNTGSIHPAGAKLIADFFGITVVELLGLDENGEAA